MFEQLVHPNERHLSSSKLAAIAAGTSTSYQAERILQCKDQTLLWCDISVFVQHDQHQKPDYIFIQCMDITKRKQAEKKLNRLAFHDPLTSLANRTLLLKFLDQAIHRYQRNHDHKFAVLFLDLDGFKLVNDSLGHLEGDNLLVAIAQRLQQETRGSDTLARFGGDEFCILLNDISGQDQAIELAKRINKALNLPFIIANEVINTTTSIGIVIASDKLAKAQDYLRDADSAMYHAKHQGRGRYAIFDASMHMQAKHQLRLRNELSRAFEQQQFVPFYQPIICIDTGQICGFESLVRWQHPERGLLSPLQFLSIVEEIHRIAEIDYYMLDLAIAQVVRWRKQFGLDELTISCNCSSEMLSSYKVIERINNLLTEYQLPAHCLNLELTESVLINDPETTLSILEQLQQLGVNIHLDDFGTGYSSLSYLHRFPIHNIKIDRSFVSRILDSNKDHAIVESIVLLANRLGITITAEGVESHQQYLILKQIGVTKTQGYYHGKPVDAQATFLLLEQASATMELD